MIRLVFAVILVTTQLIGACGNPAVAGKAVLEQQRRDFRSAERALKKGHLKQYRKLRKKLDSYPLKGYLDYRYLSRRLSGTRPAAIKRFLQDNNHAPTSRRLRIKWLYALARKGDWKTFLQEYHDVGEETTLECFRLNRLLRNPKSHAALVPPVTRLWLTGKSQPDACDPVFSKWHRAGRLNRELVLARVKLAMEKRRPGLAGYLARTYLQKPDQVWVHRWIDMHKRPTHTWSGFCR
jgi:soluble lytic murein transglycosylase